MVSLSQRSGLSPEFVICRFFKFFISLWWILAVLNADGQTASWTKVSDSVCTFARDGVSAVIFKRRVWLLGGWNNQQGTVLNSEIYNSRDGVRFKKVADAPWPGRHAFGAVVFKKKIWILSGDGHDDVWSSRNGTVWTREVEKAPWGKRYKPYVFVLNDKMWLAGGFSFYDGNYQSFNDVWSSDDGVHWKQQVIHSPWTDRGAAHGIASLDGKIWLYGGGTYGPPPTYKPETHNNDVWSTTDGLTWTEQQSSAPWVKRIHHGMHEYAGYLWVLGGHTYEGGFRVLNDVWYSIDGKKWTEFKGVPWVGRHAVTTYTFKNKMYLGFGNSAGQLHNDLWSISVKGLSFVTKPVDSARSKQPYSYDAAVDFDPNNQPVTFSLGEHPSWLQIVPATGELSGIPPEAGTARVELIAKTNGKKVAQKFVIRILPERNSR